MDKTENRLYRMADLGNMIEECKQNLREILADKNALIDQITCPQRQEVRVKGGNTYADPVYRAAQLMVDVFDKRVSSVLHEMEGYYAEYDKTNADIKAACLSAEEKRYLKLRYIEGNGAARTAQMMSYSERQCCNIRQRLLRKIAAVSG